MSRPARTRWQWHALTSVLFTAGFSCQADAPSSDSNSSAPAESVLSPHADPPKPEVQKATPDPLPANFDLAAFAGFGAPGERRGRADAGYFDVRWEHRNSGDAAVGAWHTEFEVIALPNRGDSESGETGQPERPTQRVTVAGKLSPTGYSPNLGLLFAARCSLVAPEIIGIETIRLADGSRQSYFEGRASHYTRPKGDWQMLLSNSDGEVALVDFVAGRTLRPGDTSYAERRASLRWHGNGHILIHSPCGQTNSGPKGG